MLKQPPSKNGPNLKDRKRKSYQSIHRPSCVPPMRRNSAWTYNRDVSGMRDSLEMEGE